MAARTRWTLRIERLPTRLAIGSAPQPVEVSLTLQVLADVSPAEGADRIDLGAICAWIGGEWPGSPPTALIEARIAELMDFVFRFDRRVQEVRVALARPVSADAGEGGCVSVEREATRGQFEAQQRIASALRPAARANGSREGPRARPRPAA